MESRRIYVLEEKPDDPAPAAPEVQDLLAGGHIPIGSPLVDLLEDPGCGEPESHRGVANHAHGLKLELLRRQPRKDVPDRSASTVALSMQPEPKIVVGPTKQSIWGRAARGGIEYAAQPEQVHGIADFVTGVRDAQRNLLRRALGDAIDQHAIDHLLEKLYHRYHPRTEPALSALAGSLGEARFASIVATLRLRSAPALSGCIWIRRTKRWCCGPTKNPRSRRSIGHNPYCPCAPGKSSVARRLHAARDHHAVRGAGRQERRIIGEF